MIFGRIGPEPVRGDQPSPGPIDQPGVIPSAPGVAQAGADGAAPEPDAAPPAGPTEPPRGPFPPKPPSRSSRARNPRR